MTLDAPALLRHLFDLAVAEADPMRVVPDHLGPRPDGRVLVIGAGKASARMAEALETAWGPCEGLVLTRYGYARPCKGIDIVEAAHPVPDAAGAEATQRMLDLASDLGEGDTVIALISGGGSALLCAPAAPMSLDDKQAVHRALLASGAPIGAMNVLRKHLSRIKGGQLAAAIYPARLRTLMISDVPGDDPADIASGPTVGDTSTLAEARAIIDRYDMSLPATAMDALMEGSTVIRPDDPRLSHAETHIVAAPSQSLQAAADRAQYLGVTVEILGDALEGEAADLGRAQAQMALARQAAMTAGDAPLLLLSSGECTVTGRGGGSGGPNAEFTLSAALTLNGAPSITVLACDTDGVDGAAEVAGAIATPDTLMRASAANVDPQAAMADHDSHGFFAAINSQVITGPTLTNVNDFRAILITAPED